MPPEKFSILTDPEPQHWWFIQGFVDEILPRLSLNIHNPEFSSSREDTPGPVIVVATAQLSGGGGGNQLAVTAGLARNGGKRLGAHNLPTVLSDVQLLKYVSAEELLHITL